MVPFRFHPELRQNESGAELQVKVLYVGLAQATSPSS